MRISANDCNTYTVIFQQQLKCVLIFAADNMLVVQAGSLTFAVLSIISMILVSTPLKKKKEKDDTLFRYEYCLRTLHLSMQCIDVISSNLIVEN